MPPSVREVIAGLPKVDASGLRIPRGVRIKVDRSFDYPEEVEATVVIEGIGDRDDGKEGPLIFTGSISIRVVSDRRHFLRWLRSLIQEAVLHELDEHILVDGVREFDPHKVET